MSSHVSSLTADGKIHVYFPSHPFSPISLHASIIRIWYPLRRNRTDRLELKKYMALHRSLAPLWLALSITYVHWYWWFSDSDLEEPFWELFRSGPIAGYNLWFDPPDDLWRFCRNPFMLSMHWYVYYGSCYLLVVLTSKHLHVNLLLENIYCRDYKARIYRLWDLLGLKMQDRTYCTVWT